MRATEDHPPFRRDNGRFARSRRRCLAVARGDRCPDSGTSCRGRSDAGDGRCGSRRERRCRAGRTPWFGSRTPKPAERSRDRPPIGGLGWGEYIRPVGFDLRCGDLLVSAGTRLGSGGNRIDRGDRSQPDRGAAATTSQYLSTETSWSSRCEPLGRVKFAIRTGSVLLAALQARGVRRHLGGKGADERGSLSNWYGSAWPTATC